MLDLKKKIQSVIVMVILILLGIHNYSQYQQEKKTQEEVQKVFTQRLRAANDHIQNRALLWRFSHELQRILSIPGVIDAFLQAERETLYQLVLPTWQSLKREVPDLSIMHFHSNEGISVLRMHLPTVHSDPIAQVRPLLAKVHKQQKSEYRFEAGKHGMFLRVVLPIIVDHEYLGAVEIGFQAHYIIDRLLELMDVDGHLFVEETALNVLEVPYIKRPAINRMVLWTRQGDTSPLLDMLPVDFAFAQLEKLTDDNENVYIAHSFSLPVVEDTPKAVIVLFQDITAHANRLRDSILINLGFTLLAIGIILFYLDRATGILFKSLAQHTFLSGTDSLTGIANRRRFDERMAEEIERCKRYASPMSLILLDLDHFKHINDKHGHKRGDEILTEFTEFIRSKIRRNDLLSRWGGDEFAIILTSQSLVEATSIAEKLRTQVEDHQFRHEQTITLSLGVTEWQAGESAEITLKRADSNLYRAKIEGRNRSIAC